jgi:hypothetical protein
VRLSADGIGCEIRERAYFNYGSSDLKIDAREKMEDRVVPK